MNHESFQHDGWHFQTSCFHIEMTQATCGQILAYQIWDFAIDIDQLPKYSSYH